MKNLSRRSFLQKSGIGLGATAVAGGLPLLIKSRHVQHNDEGRKINIALCGLGRYAEILAEGLEVSKYCRLAGIVTGTPSKAASWKKKYNLPNKNIYNYQNFDSIAGNKDIDLVYVVLPNSMHKEYTIRAANAGKHVITEKPMAISVQDCEEMIAAGKKAGVQLAIGYRLHYEPYNLEMKRLGQEKVFGQVRVIESSLGYKSTDPTQWRHKKALSGGGPLMNLGVYCIQSSRYTTGEEPISVTAQFGPVPDKNIFAEIEASITWQLEFPNGAMCNSTSSYLCSIDRFFASADEGTFEMSPGISYGPFKGKTSNGELNFPTINQQAAQMDGICELLLQNKSLPKHITGDEGMKDVRIMQAIYESARTGRKISLI